MYLEDKKAGFGKALKNSVGSGIFVKKVKRVDVIRTGAILQSLSNICDLLSCSAPTFPF